jgi:hypothetical protein
MKRTFMGTLEQENSWKARKRHIWEHVIKTIVEKHEEDTYRNK